jgi:hypothetical protein
MTKAEAEQVRELGRQALIAERERCAKLIELIAADWREAGADQKVWASEYLAKQIRELNSIELN